MKRPNKMAGPVNFLPAFKVNREKKKNEGTRIGGIGSKLLSSNLGKRSNVICLRGF